MVNKYFVKEMYKFWVQYQGFWFYVGDVLISIKLNEEYGYDKKKL